MNKKLQIEQRGIGLIEVLLTLIVVSIGLLGLAKFEGSLLKSSGNNKARAEAIGIAQQYMEIIRYEASSSDAFKNLNNNVNIDLTPDPIQGTNALFDVDIDIENPDLNQIINAIIDVTWVDSTGTTDSVTLMSEIALQDIQKSALNTNDSAASTAVPSPRQSASEDVRPASETVDDPNDVISPTDTPLPATGTVGVDDSRASKLAETFTVNRTDDEGPLTYTLTAIAEDSRYYNTKFGDGILGVYVCESTEPNACRYIQNHFGGITLSTSGVIYSDSTNRRGNALSDINPVWSSSEVTACFEGNVTPNGLGGDMKPYECVYAGNCTDSSGNCQQGVTIEEVASKGVGPGGEFGNLGLIGLDDSKGDQVCFLEDTPDIREDSDKEDLLNGNNQDGGGSAPQYNEAYLLPVTTRTYVTRRLLSNGEERSEGINKSFRNHNFLLVDRASNADEDNCYLAVNKDEDTLETYVLAPRNIVRVRTDTTDPVTNPVESVATFDGLMPAITVSSSTSGNRPNLYIPEVGSCYVKSDNTKFACVIPNNGLDDVDGVTIFGKSASVPTITTDASEPAVPAVFEACTFDVDETEFGNIESDTTSSGDALPDGFDCRWPTDF